MSFADWSNKKKKKEIAEASNTKVSLTEDEDIAPTKYSSFADWSNAQNNSADRGLVNEWASEVSDLMTLDSSLDDRTAKATALIKRGTDLRKLYADDEWAYNKVSDLETSLYRYYNRLKGSAIKEEQEGEGYFKEGNFGDSVADFFTDLGTGLVGMGETVVDWFASLAPAMNDAMYYQNGGGYNIEADRIHNEANAEFKGAVEDFVAEDLYDEEEVVKEVISGTSAMLGGDYYATKDYLNNEMEEGSVFGEKSDALINSAGELIGTYALSAAGVPWWLTSLSTAGGAEVESALQQGATLEEAAFSGLVSGGAEVLTEKIGGIKFGGKALDDVLIGELSTKISSKVVNKLVTYGVIKPGGEAVEEVLSQFMSNLGTAIYKEEDLDELLFSEESIDGYIDSAIGGAVLGGTFGTVEAVVGDKTKTELTENEQAVVDKVVADRVAEQEKDGQALDNKQKAEIEEQVKAELEKGQIPVDVIEDALGGDTYKAYQESIANEEALQSEYDALYKMKNGEKSDEQIDRQAELKKQLEELKTTNARDQLHQQLSDEVLAKVTDAKDSRLLESYNERTRRGQAYEADLTKYDAKQQEVIKKAVDSGILNNTNRTHEFVDMVAKISADKGVLFDFTNNEKLKESGFAIDGKTVNGYVTKDGITVNMDSSKYVNSVVGHEITHILEGTELYSELQSVLFEYAKSKGEYQARYDSLLELYKDVEGADVDAELTADLVGDYLFTDENFIKNLSTKNRNVFQKIYDEIKYLYKVATAGSKEARQLEKVKRAFDNAYRESGTAQSDTKYSLAMVEEVQPTSDKWHRTLTTEEAKARFPKLWDVAAEESEVRNPTQISSTVKSYRKVYDYLKGEGFDGTILDASSGLGYGTKAGIEEYGFDVEDIEPYPDKSYTPKYKDYSALDKKYDVVISNAVLNVLPQDQRDALVVKMGEMLNDGGRIFVNVRGKDVDTLASNANNTNISPMEWFVDSTGSYQKGFTKRELVAYLQDALGDGFTVKPTSMFGAVSAIVTKDGGVKYSLSDNNGKQLSKEQQEYFKDSKVRDENGNLKAVYHGTSNGGFTVFDTYGSNYGLFGTGSYFTDNKSVAESYTNKGKGNNKQVYETYLNITNPMDMDAPADPKAWAEQFPDATFPDSGTSEDFYRAMEEYFEDKMYPKWDAAEVAMSAIEGMGYDGITHIGGGRVNTDGTKHQVYIAFHAEQVKNADNTNPTDNPDIRYSLSDSEGKELTKEQREYFKDSKMRDEDGNLKVMYHGSENAGFHTFEQKFSDDDTSFFFVDRNDVAASYSGTTETYEARTIRTVEDMNNFLAEIGDNEDYSVIEKDGKFTLIQDGDVVATSDTAQGIYKEYCDWVGVGYGDANYKVYLNLTNPLVVDAGGRNWNRISGEFSQDVYDRIQSLTAEEKTALTQLASWEDGGIFRDELETAVESVERGASYVDDYTRNLASAAEKLGDTDMYRLFDIATDNFTEETLRENAVKYLSTRDYAQRAKEQGYDGVIFNNIHDNGGFSDGSEGASTVAIAFESNQIKSTANAKPTGDADIRYSLSDSEGRKLSAEQQEYFKHAKTTDEHGKLKPFFHGTARADRVGTVFDPNRATSGPMAFFTDNRQIGENYARDKADTSLAYDGMYDDYYTQFRIDINGQNLSVSEAWNHLPPSKRMEIREKAKHITMDDDYESVIYDESNQYGNGGFDAYTINAHKGNILEALTDSWLESGTIYGQEEMFLDVLRLAGLDNVQYMNPDFRAEKVYEVYLNITNPFDTSNISEEMLDALKTAAENAEFEEGNSADMWDKRNIPPEQWIARLEDDIKNGTTHTWTSIPDFVTDTLKAHGYDGIFDTGGKGGGESHTVAIPFYSEQIKSVDNATPTADIDITRSLSAEGEAPIRYGKYNVRGQDLMLEQEVAPVEETVTETEAVAEDAIPDGFAPITEEQATALREDSFASLDDVEAPPEREAPYPAESTPAKVDDPFDKRNWNDVGNRKVKAYMYENPEVKPFFQEQAELMLWDLSDTVKAERGYNDEVYYQTGGEAGFWGNKRDTSEDIAYLLDDCGFSYADIEKGLMAIVEDNGAENIAAAKRIEFVINDRLLKGYTDFHTGKVVPRNEEYANLLKEKQNEARFTEDGKEAFDALMENADDYAPPVEDDFAPIGDVAPVETVAPVKTETAPTEAYEAIRPKPEKQPRLARATPAEQARAEILVDEPDVESDKPSAWSMVKDKVLDKGMVFEDLSLATGNRELQARWNSIRYADGKAQRLIGEGNASVNSLNSIREEVEKSGKTKEFYEYLYHLHNADRMSLAARYEGAQNKPVFGDAVTAEESQKAAAELAETNPEFEQYAQEVYGYMTYLRELLVDGGVISRDTADLWAEMYPHYVPIRRAGDEGLNINVPLDTGKTGVNAPIKRATGGNRDILPLFDTMGQRTIQTYKAIAKNRFGVELKNTLGTTVESDALSLDDAIDSIDMQDGMLQEGKNGKKPTFTVFENGEKVTFEITEEMYNAIKPTGSGYTNKALNTISNIRKGTLTEYNPWFLLKNAVKDVQDVLINSQHSARTYAAIPKAIKQMATKGRWYTEYIENGGGENTYFDNYTNTFDKGNKALEIAKKVTGLSAISKANNVIEMMPRLAEYIASRESGRSIDVSMLDAARVTTNFAAGGDWTKFLNRNGVTFLNASVQGAVQQARNIREAKANGLKGWIGLAAKYLVAGLPAVMLNHLIWDDDEEYDELSDYMKQNYYIVGKYGDGQFVRIPKGRAVAVIQNAFEQVGNAATGDDEVDLKAFLDLAFTNLAPNNPVDNNILSPIVDVATNEAWYGGDLVPSRLQDLPAEEQYDESTDSISRWLGEKLGYSPYKINYLLDQYSGVVGDTVLPMLTPEAESGDNSLGGNLIAPLKDMFTTDSVMNNQNVSDFYETVDELAVNANSSAATDEDVLKYKYINSVNAELGELYQRKREIQNSNLADDRKYEAVRDIQKQIDAMAKESLNTYNDVTITGKYATVGNTHYRWYEPGEDSDAEPGWQKITDKQLEKQEEVTSGLGISASEYWSNKAEYDFAYESPGKYGIAKSVGGYESYKAYSSELNDIKADKDEDGKSISGSRKEKVIEYINNLDADYGTKIVLFKNEYNADDTYNYEIIDYLNNRSDISYKEMETILKELGFEVSADGTITW